MNTRFLADLRYAARGLRRAPQFTVVAVVTLALGIGAAAATYSIVDAILLHPLPFAASERLVYVRQYTSQGCDDCYEVPIGNYPDLRRAVHNAVDLVASMNWSAVLRGSERTEVVSAALVSPDFFRVLGAAPELGRTFLGEDTLASRREIVLSDQAWRTRFAADSSVIGRALTVDGVPFTVVGVMRPEATFPPRTEMWGALNTDSALAPGARLGPSVDVFGRLRPGIQLAQAAAAIANLGAQLTVAYPEAMRGQRLETQPMRRWHEDVRPVLIVFMAAVALLLLTASINLAGLLIARHAARTREIAVRVALGASAQRIARQLLTEALLLSFIGALGGVLLALWSVPVIHDAVPEELASFEPGWSHMHVNANVLVFAVALALVTALLVGVVPAIHFSRPDLTKRLKDGDREPRGGWRVGRLRQGLVVAEVALSLVLLSAAGLLVRSVVNMTRADLGIRPDHVLTMALERGAASPDTVALPRTYFDRLLDQVETMPGVVRAGVVTALPLSHHFNGRDFAIEGRPAPRPEDNQWARLQYVTPDYFSTLRIALATGRTFGATDLPDTARVAIVNRELVRRFFAGEEPLARTLIIDHRPYRVVGVVRDVYHQGPSESPGAEVYLLQRYARQRMADLAVRTSDDPRRAAPAVVAALRRYDPSLAVNRVRTMEDVVAEFMSPYRLMLGLMVGFALLALIIATIGLFGVVSYTAARRTHEFGIRLALGAERRHIRRLVLVEGLRLTLLGAAIGVAGALILTRLIRFLLYGVGTADEPTLIVVALLMGVVTLGAAYLPARRATGVDPVSALRAE